MYLKIVVLKNFPNFTGKYLCWRLQHRCFLVKLEKCLSTPFYIATLLVASGNSLLPVAIHICISVCVTASVTMNREIEAK